jgi:hypothetical protein
MDPKNDSYFYYFYLAQDASYLDLTIVVPETKSELITSVKIDTQDNFSSGGPSDKAYILYEGTGQREITKKLTSDELPGLKEDLLFIYVMVGEDKTVDDIGTVYWEYPIGEAVLKRSKCILTSCDIPRSLIDIILNYKLFKFAIKNNHLDTAASIWKKLKSYSLKKNKQNEYL